MAKQKGVFALWGTSSGSEANVKSPLFGLLKGSPSRIKDVNTPQIDFAELKSVAVKQG